MRKIGNGATNGGVGSALSMENFARNGEAGAQRSGSGKTLQIGILIKRGDTPTATEETLL